MTATHVPTNGFVNPPTVPGVPALPQNQGELPPGVPPAGPPAQVPNGNPITLPGQTPGYVPQQGVNPGQQPVQPTAQPQGQPDLTNIVALLQAALGDQPAPTAQNPAVPGQRPDWMPTSANTFDVATIEDPIIKSMATVLQSVGKDMDLDRVIGRALAYSDVSLIDYAYIQEKGGANAAQLAEIAKGIVQQVAAKADAIEKEVHALAGGEAQWNASVAVFNQAAPQELRTVVTQMLNSTNDKHIKAGAAIVAQFGRKTGHLPQQGTPFLNNAAADITGGGLSKVQFQAELAKLKPESQGYLEARQDLFARRSLGKSAGL